MNAVNKVILLVGTVLLAGWVYYFQTEAGRELKPVVQSAPERPKGAASVPVAANAVTTALPVLTSPSAAAPTLQSATPGVAVPDTRPEWVRNPPELGLTRTLSGDQSVRYDGRPRTVLGTKEGPSQPVLLVRDETSGQIDYFQSGLTFRLKPGADFEAFIRERKAMQRYFSNADYATVMVDAGSIAGEYDALQNDPRVTLVTFLKLKTMTNPR